MTQRTRVISLWQPYASFIAWGLKKYETRSWHPGKRIVPGKTLLIHAAKRKPKEYEMRMFDSIAFEKHFEQHNIQSPQDLDYGVILCATKFIQAHSTNDFVPSDFERAVGNFQPDRYAWELELIKVAQTPIMAKGQQGIWYYEF